MSERKPRQTGRKTEKNIEDYCFKRYPRTVWIIEAKLKELNMKHWTKHYLLGFLSKIERDLPLSVFLSRL